MSEVDELRAEIARLEVRLKEQGSSFCRAHDEATKAKFDAKGKLDRALQAAGDAELELTALLTSTGEDAMPKPLRVRVIRALERVQRIRRSSR